MDDGKSPDEDVVMRRELYPNTWKFRTSWNYWMINVIEKLLPFNPSSQLLMCNHGYESHVVILFYYTTIQSCLG